MEINSSTTAAPAYQTCGDVSVEAGRGPGQLAWYKFIAHRFAGHSVIDIGCGIGAGIDVLANYGCICTGQDLDPRLARHDITIGDTCTIPSGSHDYVTCIDVIEHVENDNEFLTDLLRIARRGIFMTTPLSIISRPRWPYHVREYTFPAFVTLTQNRGNCAYFKGTSSVEEVYEVCDVSAFLQLSAFLNNRFLNTPARILNRLLPRRLQNMGHQAVLISL